MEVEMHRELIYRIFPIYRKTDADNLENGKDSLWLEKLSVRKADGLRIALDNIPDRKKLSFHFPILLPLELVL